jgi:diguanylate cyclase (GGDEF)-like protein
MKGMRDVRRPIGHGVVGWVVEHCQPLLVPDVTLDSRFIGRPGSKMRSELAVPLVADGTVIGAINIESDRIAAFSDMDERLLTLTAGHIAQTIQVARLHHRFKQLAATDALTGLANHRAFYDRLDEEIRHAAVTDGVLTVAIMDVDQLKTINDSYGHLAGDAALREIASVLKDRCRRSDLACRYGGDEFAVILTDTDLEGADRAIAHIVDGIQSATLTIDGQRQSLPTGAWGMATYPDDGMRSSELVRVADLRMFSHKRFARSHRFDAGS